MTKFFLLFIIIVSFFNNCLLANENTNKNLNEIFLNNQTLQLPELNLIWMQQYNNFNQHDFNITLSDNSYINPYNKEKYLAVVTLGTVSFMVVGAGILYLMPEYVTNWDKSQINNIFSNWWHNVKKGPVVDRDNLFLNYVTHPYWGAVYYTQARTAGYDIAPSFLYSALVSTFLWEYGIEAFAEVPSIQDLIVTPVIGSIIGEFFFISSKQLKEKIEDNSSNNYFIYPLLTIMDPGWLIIEHTFLKNWVVNDEPPQPNIIANNHKIMFSLSFKLKPLHS